MLGTDKIFREEQCGSACSEKPVNRSSCSSQFTSCTSVKGGKQHLKTHVEREQLWARFLIDMGWAVCAARAASQLPPWTAELCISVLSLPHQQLYRRSETTACFHGKGEEQPTPQQSNGQQAKMLLKGFLFPFCACVLGSPAQQRSGVQAEMQSHHCCFRLHIW